MRSDKPVYRKKPAHRRRRFGRDKRGTAAIEFAIVAPIFLMLMFSIFEVGWYFFTNSVIDAAVADAARLVRTGQIQKGYGTDDERFDAMFAEVCGVLKSFGDCDERLTVEVSSYSTFSALAADNRSATCADSPPDQIDAMPFSPGREHDIIRVRICYIYTTLNPAIGMNLSESGSNERHLISTMIFRNEPYEKN